MDAPAHPSNTKEASINLVMRRIPVFKLRNKLVKLNSFNIGEIKWNNEWEKNLRSLSKDALEHRVEKYFLAYMRGDGNSCCLRQKSSLGTKQK